MSETPTKVYPYFLGLFDQLQKKVGRDPKKIALFAKDSTQLQEICWKLGTLNRFIDETLASSETKYSPQVPSEFPAAYQDFKERYESGVMEAYWDKFLGGLTFDFDLSEEDAESVGADLSSEEFEAPDFDYDEEFNPIRHEPSELIANLIMFCDDNMATWKDSEYAFQYSMANMLRMGLGAWYYMIEVVGVDLAGAASRWRKVPHIFVPKHVSDAHRLTEKGSLYDLLQDAVRAYVFGAPSAAVAMCRAIWELVLKQHYDLEVHDDEGKEIAFDKVISLAEKKYYWMRRLQLHAKRKHANKTLHRFSDAKRMTWDDEKIVLDYLVTAKTLIEKAPSINAGQ